MKKNIFASSQWNATTVSTHDNDLIRILIFIWCQLAKILPSPVDRMQLYKHALKDCISDFIMQRIMLIGGIRTNALHKAQMIL